MFYHKTLLAMVAVLFFLLPVSYAVAADTDEDISSIFCKDMAKAETYEEKQFESYKMLIPGDDGWIFRTETDLISDFTFTREGVQNMRDLNQAFESRGIKLVFFMTPTRGLVHGQHISDEDKKRFGFTNINKAWENYTSAINDLRKEGLDVVGVQRQKSDESFFYKRDHHWNANGARISAGELANYIKNMSEFQDIEKVSFVTKDGEDDKFMGVSKKVFKKICNTNQPAENIQRKYTERAVETAGQQDLFGDVKSPEIVLMGTSNSTMEPSYANFEGFFKEALVADVLNMSVSGGGLDTAMLAYFNSNDYKQNPAKIAVWEVPSYYQVSNHGKFFREAIPAAYGSCSNPVVEAKGVRLDDKTTIAMSKLADHKIHGRDYYLNVRFSKPVLKPFSVEFLNLKNREKHRFHHSNRYAIEKDFFLRLENDKDNALDKVIITVPKELFGLTADMRICQQPKATFFAKK